MVGRITNVRNFRDHYAIVLSGSADVPVDTVRHAYLHFLLDQLPLQYPHVIAVKRPLYEGGAHAPRLTPDLRDDYPSYFAECLVRAVELKLKKMSPGEREAAMERTTRTGTLECGQGRACREEGAEREPESDQRADRRRDCEDDVARREEPGSEPLATPQPVEVDTADWASELLLDD